MKKILLLTISLLLLLAPLTAFAAEDLRFSSTAEVERPRVNAKGEKVMVREPATLLQPGEIAIYTNIVTNIGQQPAEEIVIDNPLPENTEYLGGSATENGYVVLFSVDKGKSFGGQDELTVPDGQGVQRPAEPKDYTNIRWTMQSRLQPGATGIVEFRVRVR